MYDPTNATHPRTRRGRLTRIALLALGIAACGSSDVGVDGGVGGDLAAVPGSDFSTGAHDSAVTTPHDLGGTGTPPDLSSSTANPDLSGTHGAPLTIVTMVFENTSYDSIVGQSQQAPFINQLIADYGLATMYSDSLEHPSLPNYLYMISGDPQYPGVVDVGPRQGPYFPAARDNLGKQMTAAGVPWRAYMESMGTPCRLTDKSPYATKHNPFIYFTDLQSDVATCNKVDVDYSNFFGDLDSGAYRYLWVTPNLNSDGHDTDLPTADHWLSQQMARIQMSKPWLAGSIVVFITWDEGARGGLSTVDHVPMIVVSPRIKSKGYQSSATYDHGSYLATVEDLLGLPRLATVTSAKNLLEFLQ